MDSQFNYALFRNETYSTYKAAFVVQRLKQVVHPTIRDVTEKNDQGCQTGTRWILVLNTLVQHMSK